MIQLNPPRKILICGLPGTGKTTLGDALAPLIDAVHWDGDDVRRECDGAIHLSFSLDDRLKQAQRMGWLCDRVIDSGRSAIASFICPTLETRRVFDPSDEAFVIWCARSPTRHFSDTSKLFVPPEHFNIMISDENIPPKTWAEHAVERLCGWPQFNWKKSTALLIGRYQPFHAGHKALLTEALNRVEQVTIGVRDTSGTPNNPFTFWAVCQTIWEALADYRGRYNIIQLPNITNVFYGRDVGYNIERLVLDADVEAIRATDIRKSMDPSASVSPDDRP